MYNQLVKGILILVKGIDAFIESIQSMCGSNDIIQSCLLYTSDAADE